MGPDADTQALMTNHAGNENASRVLAQRNHRSRVTAAVALRGCTPSSLLSPTRQTGSNCFRRKPHGTYVCATRTRSTLASGGLRISLTPVPSAFGIVEVVIAIRVLKVVDVALAVRVAVGGGRAGRHTTIGGDVWVLAVITIPLLTAGVKKLIRTFQAFAAGARTAVP